MLKQNITFILLLLAIQSMRANIPVSAERDSFPDTLTMPSLEYGTATLKGTIERNLIRSFSTKNIPTIRITNPAKEAATQEIFIESDGTFELSIPVVGISNCVISSPMFNATLSLLPGRLSTINIDFQDSAKPLITITDPSGLSSKELQLMSRSILDIAMKMPIADYGNNPHPTEYVDAYIRRLQKTDQLIDAIDALSDNVRFILHRCLWGMDCSSGLLQYKINTKNKYRREHKNLSGYVNYPIERSHYQFLRKFDLNNPKSLYSFVNSDLMNTLLTDSVLNIPNIASMPLEKWRVGTKAIFNDLIGENNQFFIDLLTLNAYSRQIQGSRLLSQEQIRDIETYFTKGNLSNFLFDENSNMRKTLQQTEKLHPLVINQTPESAKGELLKNIVAKYKGKVVFVDFWATWCAPCIAGMQLSKPVKSEYSQKDVTFVYITSTSSPKKLWENKIPQIGGEHYYLSMEKNDEIMDQYNFSTIPMYMVFDKEGNLLHQEGSISPAKMREWLDEALKK